MTEIFQKLRETRLPLVPHLETICGALEEQGVLIVRSDPGSGKSTLLPLALMDWDAGSRRDDQQAARRILMLEPRRAAVLGIASRMADLLGEAPGERIGYAVRMHRKHSPRTRVEVLTEGLLVRRLQGDSSLRGVSTVIFDEFHERSVYTDLALAFMLDLRRMGAEVRLLIMSATMDAPRIAGFIDSLENRTGKNPVPVIDCPGRSFPVEIRYRPLPGKAPLGVETAAALGHILETGNDTQALVFLPGKGEIGAAAAALGAGPLGKDFEILPLHGGLPLSRQRRVLSQGGGRRIILSTNVAESALTVPGITLVVDTGYARIENYHIPTAMNRLCLEPISRQSADQRAGRAGRLGPGRCVRLWDESLPRPPETECEIRRIDLSGLVLECLLWGVRTREELPWLDPPPDAAWARALELLESLGALDPDGRPSRRGRELAALGLGPRLGTLCLAGRDGGRAALACAAAAILADRDGSGIRDDADFSRRLSMVRNRPGLPWVRGITETAEDLLRRLGLAEEALSWEPRDEAGVGDLLAAAFPDRIARRQAPPDQGGPGKFRFVSGREARIQGPLESQEWLVAPEADAGERTGFIRLAAPLSPEAALGLLEPQIRTEEGIRWKGLVPRSTLSRYAGRLLISEEGGPGSREGVLRALPRLLEDRGLAVLPWEEDRGAPRRLLDRIRFFAAHGGPAEGAAFTDEALVRDAALWLGPHIREGRGAGKAPVIDGKGLMEALLARLGWEQKHALDTQAPECFSLPRGKKRLLDYGSGEPELRLRLQEAFGIGGESRIMGVPVVFCLLSPADRPIQITRDLAGFWTGSYAAVRREMRGRYPKHSWPEDPRSPQ
ncbi:MAG: ATP-dependent helicase HrpB [Treponema sp.]|nr:ATP-dependent helicase HrpB [Treponema sp.]